MMKIAVLANTFIPHMGGAQVFTYNLLKNLAERSHQVHLFISYYRYRQFTSLPVMLNFKVFPLFFMRNRSASYFASFNLFFKQFMKRYDLWQVIGSYPAGYISTILAARVPIILRCYGEDIQKESNLGYGLRFNPILEDRIKLTLSKMTRLVALTPTVRSCYVELGAPDEKIIEIPNGIDIERFKQRVDRRKNRNSLGIKEDEIFILTIGRYNLKKGYEFIPEAAKLLISHGFNIRWLIVGKDVGKLKHIVEEYELGKTILLKEEIGISKDTVNNDELLLPPRSILELYKSADIFVLPSLIETFGTVIIEAMAAGLPVVTTDAGGCRDVVKHEVNGLLAEPSNSISLAENIERMLTDSGLKGKMQKTAEMTVKDYDWQRITDQYENLYFQLIKS